MKLGILALALAGVLFLSPLAMSGSLSSSDTNFLFSGDQVATTTLSAQEMQSTLGQLLDGVGVIPLLSPIVGHANGSIFNACSTAVLGSGCSIVIVGGD